MERLLTGWSEFKKMTMALDSGDSFYSPELKAIVNLWMGGIYGDNVFFCATTSITPDTINPDTRIITP
jgi:hypothetical protein